MNPYLMIRDINLDKNLNINSFTACNVVKNNEASFITTSELREKIWNTNQRSSNPSVKFENLKISRGNKGNGSLVISDNRVNYILASQGCNSSISVACDLDVLNDVKEHYKGYRIAKIVYREHYKLSDDEKRIDLSKVGSWETTTYSVVSMELQKEEPDGSVKKETISAETLQHYIILSIIANKDIDWSNVYHLTLEYGIPVFKISQIKFDVLRKDKNWVFYETVLEHDKTGDTNVRNWLNKNLMTGEVEFVADSAGLYEYKGNAETIALPEFLFIDAKAFSRSSVKKVILTSQNTITFPLYENMQDIFPDSYKNKREERIEIVYRQRVKTRSGIQIIETTEGLDQYDGIKVTNIVQEALIKRAIYDKNYKLNKMLLNLEF